MELVSKFLQRYLRYVAQLSADAPNLQGRHGPIVNLPSHFEPSKGF